MEIREGDNPFEENYDLFITIGGFEERTLNSIKELGGKNIEHTLLIKYLSSNIEINQANDKNFLALESEFVKISKISIVENLLHSPKKTIFEISEILNQLSKKKIIVDISSMNDNLIYNLIYLLSKLENTSIEIMYTIPESYDFINWELGEIKRPLENYVSNIVIVPNFEGHPKHIKKDLLIIFPGFEIHRSYAIAIRYDSAEGIILIPNNTGDDLIDKRGQLAKKLHEDFIATYDFKPINIDFFDLAGIFNKLVELNSEYREERNIIISSFGSKVQTVGSALLASIINRNIRVLNAEPLSYFPKYYSSGIYKSIYFKIIK